MSNANFFFLTVLIVVLGSRLSVFFVPEVDILVFGFVVHHFWFAIPFLALAGIVRKKYSHITIFLYAIGVGFIVDQLAFMLLGGGKDQEYWSLPSLVGTVIVLSIVFFCRKKLANFLAKK